MLKTICKIGGERKKETERERGGEREKERGGERERGGG